MKKYIFFIALGLLIFAPQILLCIVVVAFALIVLGASIGLLYLAITQSPYDSSNNDD